MIKLSYDTSVCSYDANTSTSGYNDSYCMYKVVIYGKANTSTYEISAHTDGTIYQLKENEPRKQFIAEEEMQYFSFTILNATNTNGSTLSEVKFTQTIITGDVVMLTSTTERYPSFEKSDHVSYSSKPVSYQSHSGFLNLTGTYYIAVYAYDASYYSLRTLL
ncbi:MAG: hypothetical protein QF535_13235 [Anaerolineales bacterium]|nr:hypothetical protein [Anaerolineales bacterium]